MVLHVHVAIAGAHGQIALQLGERLVARGDLVTGLIRNPVHAGELRERGADPVLCDLEEAGPEQIARTLGGADAVVFAAGAGPGSGPERKLTVDRDGALALLEAARHAGIGRYVMISAVGAEDPPAGEEVFAVYLRAKAQADAGLMASELAWTVVRPGALTDEPATGRADVRTEPFRGRVPRADVAALLELVLHDPATAGRVLYVNGGERSLADALAAALA